MEIKYQAYKYDQTRIFRIILKREDSFILKVQGNGTQPLGFQQKQVRDPSGESPTKKWYTST